MGEVGEGEGVRVIGVLSIFGRSVLRVLQHFFILDENLSYFISIFTQLRQDVSILDVYIALDPPPPLPLKKNGSKTKKLI